MTTDKERLAALLPCPFCGSTDLGHGESAYCSTVICRQCRGAMQRPNYDGARQAWNTRISDSGHAALEQENARLRAALEHYMAIDDGVVNFMNGFADKPRIDQNSIARKALHNPTEAKP